MEAPLSIQLRFEPTFWDVVRVIRAINRVQAGTRALFWAGGLALAAGLLSLFLPYPWSLLATTLIGVGGFLLLFLWLLPIPFAWMTRSGSPLWKGEQSFELDEQGIRATHPSARSFLAWSAVRDVRETKRLFLLFTSSQGAAFIPKSALPPDQVHTLRQLLSSQVGPARIITAPAPVPQEAGDEAITGRFTWTLRGLYHASLDLALHGSRVWAGSVLFLTLLVVLNGAPYVYRQLSTGGFGALNLKLVLLYAFPLLFILALAPLTVWWAARQQLRTRRASQGEQVVAIGESGVRASGSMHNGTVAWDAFTRVVETRHHFVFCVGKLQGLAVPSSAFTPEQRQALRALAKEKLGSRFVQKVRH